MLDIKTASSKEENQNQAVREAPIPRPKLEFPSIEPEKNYLVFFSVSALIIVLVSAVGLYVLKANKDSALKTKNAEYASLQQQINSPPLKDLDKQIVDLQNGLAVYQSTLSGKIYWSKMFTELERTVPKSIIYTALSVDEKKALKVSGLADDFSSIAKLMASLTSSKGFTNVKLVSSQISETAGVGKVSFSLSFNVIEASLKKSAISVQPPAGIFAPASGSAVTGTSETGIPASNTTGTVPTAENQPLQP